jgi:hypothetical protein
MVFFTNKHLHTIYLLKERNEISFKHSKKNRKKEQEKKNHKHKVSLKFFLANQKRRFFAIFSE